MARPPSLVPRQGPAFRGRPAWPRYGYGAGIYIDNARHNSNHSRCQGDIQFNHSAEKLRDDWMRPYWRSRGAAAAGGSTRPGL